MRKLKARYFLLGPEHEDSIFDDVIGANRYHAMLKYKGLTMDVARIDGWNISLNIYGRFFSVYGVKWMLGLMTDTNAWQFGKWHGRWFCG